MKRCRIHVFFILSHRGKRNKKQKSVDEVGTSSRKVESANPDA